MIEELAEEIHNIWMKWTKALMKVEKISSKRTNRWHTCFIPYKELSEGMKEKDRKIAKRLLKIITKEKDNIVKQVLRINEAIERAMR